MQITVDADFHVMLAECGTLGPFLHRAHSYGYIIYNGSNRVNSTSEFYSKGWKI